MAKQPSAAEPQSASVGPGSNFRAILSFLLFVHLLGVAIAMATDTEYGGSELLTRVKVGSPTDDTSWSVGPYWYLYQLWQDVGYNYFYTYGDPLNADHFLQVELKFKDGRTENLVLPQGGTWFDRQRMNQLAYRIALLTEVPDRRAESLLPGAIGAGLIKPTGADEVILRARRLLPLTREAARSPDKETREPRSGRLYRTVYTAQVKVVEGEPQVLRIESAGDVAPVVTPTRRPAPVKPRPGSESGAAPITPPPAPEPAPAAATPAPAPAAAAPVSAPTPAPAKNP